MLWMSGRAETNQMKPTKDKHPEATDVAGHVKFLGVGKGVGILLGALWSLCRHLLGIFSVLKICADYTWGT